MSRDVYFTIENSKLIKNIENDGATYLRKGADLHTEEVNFSKYKKDPRVLSTIADWQKATGQNFFEKVTISRDQYFKVRDKEETLNTFGEDYLKDFSVNMPKNLLIKYKNIMAEYEKIQEEIKHYFEDADERSF